MLEVLYDVATKEVRAWNADDSVQGNLKPKKGQEVVILPIDPPSFESDVYYVDLTNGVIVGNPDYNPLSPDDMRASEILANSPDVITLPEMWELVRIFGRRLGFRF